MNGVTVTTNITFPRDDWKALKIVAMEQGISMAEFVRQVVGKSVRHAAGQLVRRQKLTVNGFTPEFEKEVLAAEREPVNQDIVWNGKGSFVDFVLKHSPSKIHKS